MARVVLDTDIIVTALRSATGGSNAVLREAAHGRLTPLVTPALFLEYEAVLKRPEQRLAHGLGLSDIDRFLEEGELCPGGARRTTRFARHGIRKGTGGHIRAGRSRRRAVPPHSVR